MPGWVIRQRKGKAAQMDEGNGSLTATELEELATGETTDGLTMVILSGDLDKVLAAFIIANGAAAMDTPVTMFFTFWGLNALRKSEAVPVKKSFIESMFARMMPRGADKLTLSKMNMLGLGTKMMKNVMKKHNVLSLPELIETARASGVKLVACKMTMDVMGLQQAELLDGVEIGGVATMLDSASRSKTTLFI